MLKNLLAVIVIFLFTDSKLFAADFEFGRLSQAEIDMKSYPEDANAHAVVLNEYGRSYISSTDDRIILIHEYHVRIKFFDSHDFKEHGDVEVPLYKEDASLFESISNVQGITFSPDGSGSYVPTALDPKKVFNVSENKYHNLAKFAMPGLKNGSIVEYKYTITSPFLFNFKKWVFQWDIPKIHSAYKAEIPAIYNFNILLRGPLKLTKTDAVVQRDCFSENGTKCDCSDITYIMDNIPAFVEEDYMTAAKNFVSAIYFELSDYVSLRNGVKIKATKEWKDIDYNLKSSEFFGSQIKRSGLMKDRIKDVIAGKTSDIDKALALYNFVQKNIKWDGFYSKFSDDGIRTALNNHTGTIGDINLTLIAALNAAGIPADAVMLSTRDHGAVNKLYPTESDFDYVIARTTIAGKVYLLDASEPLLGFGLLPLRCLNDQGRVISMTQPSYWLDITEPERKSEISTLDLNLQSDGKLKGKFSRFFFGYGGYEKRKAIKKFNTPDEYVEDLDDKMHRIKILKYTFNNLDSLDKPFSENYEIEVTAFDNMNKDRLSLSPFLFGSTTVNPFKLADRSYPVDMGIASDDRYIFNLHLPANYEVETTPQNTGITMPDHGGTLITDFQDNGEGNITYSRVMRLSKPVYASAEYPYLKEMFNKLILAEKAEIVLKKKVK